jgi:hypothetical protein
MSSNLIHYPPNPAYGTGCYRRRIIFLRRTDGIDVALLDDYHDMGVALTVDDGLIVDVAAHMDRFPKTSCPGAVAALRMLIGRSASASAAALSAEERGGQCTHLVELARLGLTRLVRGEPSGIAEIALTDRDEAGRQQLTLELDGKLARVWVLQDEAILEPDTYRGRSLFGGFIRWVDAQFPPEEADLWRMAQMAAFVARGRAYVVDGNVPRRVADEPSRHGACHSFSGAAFETAYDNTGYVRDMSSGLPPLREIARSRAKEGA